MSNAEDRSRPDGSPGDAVEVTRRHPQWFFPDGEFDRSQMLALLTREAIVGGAANVMIGQVGQWITFRSDIDWLHNDLAAFYALTPLTDGGVNMTRAEVALTAFSEAVVTKSARAKANWVTATPGVGDHPATVRPPASV